MNSKYIQRTISLVVLIVASLTVAQAQFLSNTTWIKVFEDNKLVDSLIFGTHVDATYSLDIAIGENFRPQYPPVGLEVDFVPLPGKPDASWGPGLWPKCLYGFSSTAKKDTFVLRFRYYSDTDSIVRLEWPDSATLAAGCDSMFLFDPTDQLPIPNVNMMSQSNVSIDSMFTYYPTDRLWIYRYTRPVLIDGIFETTPGIPVAFALDQNYPNPFNPSSVIRYQIPVVSKVSLKVYNVLGQVIATLVNEAQHAGYKSVEFDARSLPSGLYIYRLQAGNFTSSRKMLLLR